MAIIHCPACGRRMSSIASACPSCHQPVGELDQEQRDQLALRRWRAQIHRAHNLTYLAMGIVMAGLLMWWVTPPQGLNAPVGTFTVVLLGLGLVGYLASWGWRIWLGFTRRRGQ